MMDDLDGVWCLDLFWICWDDGGGWDEDEDVGFGFGFRFG